MNRQELLRWLGGQLLRRVLPLLILAGVIYGVYRYWPSGEAPQASGPQASGQPIPVQTIILRAKDTPMEPTFLGQTESSQTVQIRARVEGILKERSFEEGETVQQNQPLFRIDPEPFQLDLRMAKASLASAEARLGRARQQLRRDRTLGASGGVSGSELEDAQAEERVASAEVVKQQAQIARSELELTYTTIKSPITGSIGRAQQDVGSYIDPATTGLLAEVKQVDPMYVRYSVSEQEMLRWQRLEEEGRLANSDADDVELEVTLGDGRVYPHRGRINFVDIQVDPATGTAVIRGTLANPKGTLRPGQFVHAKVLGVLQLNTLVVPQRAVLQLPIGSCVYVVKPDKTVELRAVKLGEWAGEDWVVLDGLKTGEQIIIDRLMQVRPGMPVDPKPINQE